MLIAVSFYVTLAIHVHTYIYIYLRPNHLRSIPPVGEDTFPLTYSHPHLLSPVQSKTSDSAITISPSVITRQECPEKGCH